MVGLRHRMARHFVPGIKENGKLPQHAIDFGTETSKNVESKKNTNFGPKSSFRGFMGFLRPTPPYGKLRGRSTYLLLQLTYLAEKITTDMPTPGWALYRARINLLN